MPDSMNRRQALFALAGGATFLVSRPLWAASRQQACAAAGGDGMKVAACRRKILFGSATSAPDIANPDYARLVARECAVVTPTWEMKWGSTQWARGSFNFAPADRIANFARNNDLALHGHTLVWQGNIPKWLPAEMNSKNWYQLFEEQFSAVIGRYRSQAYAWDVVNEAIEPNDGRADGLRVTPWLKAAGPEFLPAAYKLAARYAPTARLVYNDYGLEHEAGWTRKRRVAVLKLLEGLKKNDAPVHALGLQSHLRVGDAFDAGTFARFLDEVRALGITPVITEFDVRADRVIGADEKDRHTADLAKAYLDVALAGGVDTLVCWGLSDDKSWRAVEEPDDRPLPFDRSLHPKPLYQAIRSAIANRSI